MSKPTGRPRTQTAVCTVEGCEKKPNARSLCSLHYDRWRRFATTDKPARQPAIAKPCTIDGCKNLQQSRGWCSAHYSRWKRNGDPMRLIAKPAAPKPEPKPKPVAPPCTIEGCEGKHHSRGWCHLHYKRWRKHGDPMVGGVKREPKPERVTVPAKTLTDPPKHLVAFLRKREARLKGSRTAQKTGSGTSTHISGYMAAKPSVYGSGGV